jgi:hypothetical protein
MSSYVWLDQVLSSDVPKMNGRQVEDLLQGVYEELKLDRQFLRDSTRHYRLLEALLDRKRDLRGLVPS